MTLDEFYESFSTENFDTGEKTTEWNTAVQWQHKGDTVLIFENGKHRNTWNAKPAKKTIFEEN